MKKKFSICFLAIILCLVFCGTAFADNSASAQDTDVIQARDHILLGNYDGGPVDWIILDNEQMNDGNPGFFLFAKYVVQESGVMYDYGYANWPGSVAQSCCTDFYNAAFTDLEKTVIPAVNVTEERSELYDLYYRPADLVNECVFYISAPELAKYYGPYDGADGLTATAPDGHIVYYWLRSPHGYHEDYSGIVYENNQVHDHLVYISWGGRPATNMQLDNVLYVTAAGTEEDGTTLWKPAVIDPSSAFEITGCNLKDSKLEISYQSGVTGNGAQLCMVIYDADGKVAGNAVLSDLSSIGTVDLTLSDYNIPEGGTIAFCSLIADSSSAIDIVSAPAEVRCSISFLPGAGSGTMESVYAVPGTTPDLPDCTFTAPAHQQFDHWEMNGVTVSTGDTVTDNMELTAVYTDIPVSAITLSPSGLTFALGESTTVTADVAPDDAANPAVNWKASRGGIVKLTRNTDGSCKVTAKRAGTTTLVCASDDGAATASIEITVQGSPIVSFLRNVEGPITGLLLSAAIILFLLLRPKKNGAKLSVLSVLAALIPLVLFVVLFLVFSLGSFSSAGSDVAAETAEPVASATPEPVLFVEPEMDAGTPVFINGGKPSQGSFSKDGVLYVKLSDAAALLDTSMDYDADSDQFSLPWRNSAAVLQPDTNSIYYNDAVQPLDAEMLLCDNGSDIYVPVQAFCDALQIGTLNDEENQTLYCTPGAGDWELPQGCTVPVFMYHGTGYADDGANLIVSGEELEKQLQYLTENGFTTIWFEDLWNVENIENPVILTFDDGWRNNYTTLYPLLEKYNCKATIFVVTDYLDHSNNHLTSEQVVEMSQSPYVSIQSHTVSHEDLDAMTSEKQAYQMEQSRLLITRLTGKEPLALAYPEGGATQTTQDLAMQYYRFACRMYSPVCYNTSDDPSLVYRLYVGRETAIESFILDLNNGISAANEKAAQATVTETEFTGE